MPTILTRIFLIYNLLLYLVPEKLRPFFLPSSRSPRHQHHHINTATAGESGRRPSRAMDPTELRRVFQMFDHNGDGRITKKELSDSLENLRISIPGEELEDMIARVDANGDGCVDIDEFEALYRLIMVERGGEEEEEDMKDAFGVFDLNGDGFITVEELRAVLASMGLKQGKTLEDCRRMIKQVDVDGDGRVNYKEFKRMMKRGGFSALG